LKRLEKEKSIILGKIIDRAPLLYYYKLSTKSYYVAVFNISALTISLKKALLHPYYLAYLVNQEGKVLIHTSNSSLVGKSLIYIEPVYETVVEKEECDTRHENDRYVNTDGEKVVAGGIPLTEYNFGMILELPESLALAPINMLLKYSYILLFVVLFISFFLAKFFSKSLTKPLEELLDGLNAISLKNFKHRVNITTGDEIEELGKTFNKMAANLDKVIKLKEKERKRAEINLKKAQTSIKNTLFLSDKIASSDFDDRDFILKESKKLLDLSFLEILFFKSAQDLCHSKNNELLNKKSEIYFRNKYKKNKFYFAILPQNKFNKLLKINVLRKCNEYLIIPFVLQNRMIGIFIAGDKSNAFSKEKLGPVKMITKEIMQNFERMFLFEELEKSEQKYRELFEKSSLANIVINENAEVLMYNQKFLELFEITEINVSGRRFFELIKLLNPELLMRLNEKMGFEKLKLYEFQFKKTSKQTGWAKAIISPIPKSEMFLVSFEDITSKNKLYELEQKKFKEISIINKISKLQIKTTDSKTFIRNILAIIHGELGLNSSAIIAYKGKKVVSKEFLGKSDFVK
ncbi:MAG: PAS domain S-box protein, partial [Actinomycetia bacterium]|nr:PAS domain S-box protein [Actinomycetes bacterium]